MGMGQDKCKEVRKGWRAGLPLYASQPDYVWIGFVFFFAIKDDIKYTF